MFVEILVPFTLGFWLAGFSAFFCLLWVLHLRVRNASLADVGFCLAFGLIVLTCGIFSDGDLFRRVLIAGMGLVYAFRLGRFLFLKRVWHKPEDSRYQTIRAKLGSWEPVGIFAYFQVQVPASLFFAGLPCWVMNHPANGLGWWDGLGVLIFFVAILGESLADQQLEVFRENPNNTGKTLQTGLWRYSRHPNYFFEWLIWMGFALFAASSPFGWIGLLSPALILFFLFRVTGIPATEAQALRSKGDQYRRYQETTSAFVPWPPSQEKS